MQYPDQRILRVHQLLPGQMVAQLANSLKYRPPATDIKLAHPPTPRTAALQLHYAGQRMCAGRKWCRPRLGHYFLNHERSRNPTPRPPLRLEACRVCGVEEVAMHPTVTGELQFDVDTPKD